MELPKNITQIGESDRNCKIYVEDYVISYIKQMNQMAANKDIAVALYGIHKEENQVSYLFLYGACKLNFLQREVKHLSQAQIQEVEKQRKLYFSKYQFLGYRLLNGEMVEGFHVYEQEICRYIKGYACFYEKNDNMLAYMLANRNEEAAPEEVPQEKYEKVRQKQDERRQQFEENTTRTSSSKPRELRGARASIIKKSSTAKMTTSNGVRIMRSSVVGMFVLLCIVGVATLKDSDKLENFQVAARQMVDELTEQKIPDSKDSMAAMSNNGQTDTLIMEDKLAQAVEQENAVPMETTPSQEEQNDVSTEATVPQEVPQPTENPESEPTVPSSDIIPPSSEVANAGDAITADNNIVATPEPISYTIQAGDTLIGISTHNYGTEEKVKEICTLNDITNPDNIHIGQKILLP